MNFTMAQLCESPLTLNYILFSVSEFNLSFGLLVDGGAPYLAFGFTVLFMLRSSLGLPHSKFDPIPTDISHFQLYAVLPRYKHET